MANAEQLARLKKGAKVWNKWRDKNFQVAIDLTQANLKRVDLSGANLFGADLRGVNLSEADLSEANLNGANLSGANLAGADLARAHLESANLFEADLTGAIFIGANLYGANLKRANLSAANLRGAIFTTRILAHREREWDEICFTALYPKEGKVETWHTLLVYAHLLSAMEDVFRDAERFKDQLPKPKGVTSHSTQIARGTEITIIPSCDGIVFNPERVVFKWMERYHRADFRFSADKSLSNDAGRGQINIYAGPVLVGTLKFALLLNEADSQIAREHEEHSIMYHQDDIFVSYSHKDSDIVLACKKAYQALGFNILIDIDTLRSGQVWNEELMQMIDRATIFQLFWSHNARQSKYCRQEWEHALKRNKAGFIRPVYWEIPMPDPPEELSRYHFEYMQLKPRILSSQRIIGLLEKLAMKVVHRTHRHAR